MRELRNLFNANMEEIKDILNDNKGFYNMLIEYIEDCEMDFIRDYIKEIKNSLKRYEISFDGINYIYVDNDKYNEFIEGLKKIQKYYELFNDEEYKIILYTEKLIDIFKDMNYDNKQYDNLSNRIDDMIDKISDMFIKYINNITDNIDDYIDDYIDNFIEYYKEELFFNPNTLKVYKIEEL